MDRRETIEAVKKIAKRESNHHFFLVKDNPFDLLKSVAWVIPQGTFPSQEEISQWNIKLDEKGCLGRVAQSAIIVEEVFPLASIMYGEVWQDALRNEILKNLRQRIKTGEATKEELEDILLYEEPHAVLMIDGRQYDPLSNQLGFNLEHPRVQRFPVWEAITAARIVSKAHLEKNPANKLELLTQAEKLCPRTMLVAENRAAAWWFAGHERRTLQALREILSRRPTARCLFSIWALTEDRKYLNWLNEVYSPLMAEILQKEAGI